MPALALRQQVTAAMYHRDDSYENDQAELIRAILQVFDIALAFLRHVVQFAAITLPGMIKDVLVEIFLAVQEGFDVVLGFLGYIIQFFISVLVEIFQSIKLVLGFLCDVIQFLAVVLVDILQSIKQGFVVALEFLGYVIRFITLQLPRIIYNVVVDILRVILRGFGVVLELLLYVCKALPGIIKDILVEMLLAVQQVFAVTFGFLRYLVQLVAVKLLEAIQYFSMQLQEGILIVLRYVLPFAIAHERGIANLFLLFAIFPDYVISVFIFNFYILRAVILLILEVGTNEVRGGSYGANYRSRSYRGLTPANRWFGSQEATNFRVERVHPMSSLLRWVFMVVSIALYLDSSHKGQALREMFEAISKSSP